MRPRLLLGDEAIAQGVIDAGIRGAFGYPGTPSTEIFEYIQAQIASGAVPISGEEPIAASWAANEKVAYEEALGMSYAGGRAVVTMKHVGLNVAADPFMNSALTGVNAGMVLVVADDPGMHSSQNEQDSRHFAEFARIPVLEPANQQQAYDMAVAAFELSESVGLPVMIRIVTRLAHSRANVRRLPVEQRPEPKPPGKPDANAWTLVPANARKRFARLVRLQPELVQLSNDSALNTMELAGPHGIITTGIAANYVGEALRGGGGEFSRLHIGQYPIPVQLVRELVDHCEDILVVEDGYPFVESRLSGLLGLPGKAVRGRLSGDLPATGELTPDLVAKALGRAPKRENAAFDDLAARPPQLCSGCPHGDTFRALVEATADYDDPILFSDIGCYTLGVMPPYRAVHACVDMGASIAMAHGASQSGRHPVICTIGDSTFGHSGMTGLLGAAARDANMTVMILDNATTAMTGAQDSLTCGDRLIDILGGLGVDPAHIHVLDPRPRHHKDNVAIVRSEIEHPGLSVLIPTRACIHVGRKASDEKRARKVARKRAEAARTQSYTSEERGA